ncbi:hypothetical protein FOZ61_009558 [Perkinsus olseni]|uniref:Uncharacterized protein n=1 Tax=Perkinsus olseni TaxID=32597 RepID=A0A7J6KZ50_PEROL|nr:hypothetical protein FOZ61_009558 [Perkinsus olseni]KAF4653910.1 hypothetical protein FOL46_008955 [Perkinsus olseni]
MLTNVFVTPLAVLASGDTRLEAGKYCVVQEEYDSPSKAKLVYNYLDWHSFKFEYDDIFIRDSGEILLRRHGDVEGPNLYPYLNVAFNLSVVPGQTDSVRMAAKDGSYVHYLTTQACTELPKPGRAKCHEKTERRALKVEEPRNYYASHSSQYSIQLYADSDKAARAAFTDGEGSTFEYDTGWATWELGLGSFCQLLTLNSLMKLSSYFVEIQADFVFDVHRNLIHFVPRKPGVHPGIKPHEIITLQAVPSGEHFW